MSGTHPKPPSLFSLLLYNGAVSAILFRFTKWTQGSLFVNLYIIVVFVLYQEHFDVCQRVPVQCTNKCGLTDIPRDKVCSFRSSGEGR